MARGWQFPPMARKTSMGTWGRVRQWLPGHRRSCLWQERRVRAAAWQGRTLHPTGVPLAGLSTPLPSRRLLGTHRLLSLWSRGQAGTVTCLDGEPPGLRYFLGAHVRALDVADGGEGAMSWQHRAWPLRSPSPHGEHPGDRRGQVLPCRRAGGSACSGSSCPGWLDVPSSVARLRGSSRRRLAQGTATACPRRPSAGGAGGHRAAKRFPALQL